MELTTISTSLIENTFSDQTVEELCRSLDHRAISTIITDINEREKLWDVEVRHMKRYVGGGRRYGLSSVMPWTLDHLKEGLWPRTVAQFILCAVLYYPQFVLDLHMVLKSSPKYFALVYRTEEKSVTLLKFRKEHLGERLFKGFITLLYSNRNNKKRDWFNLLPLPVFDQANW